MKIKTALSVKVRSGAILPLAMIMVVILLIIGIALLRLGLNARLQAIRAQRIIMANMAADAGMVKAIAAMRKKQVDEYIWDNATLPSETDVTIPGSDQKYTYMITGDPSSGWDVASTGLIGASQKTVHCKLEVRSSWFGIGVKQNIDIKNGATFGTYPNAGDPLILRTNSITGDAVTLKAGVTIPGDVVCGPGGDPALVIDTKSNTVITGDTYAADVPMEFPAVVVPPDLVSLAKINYASEPNISGDRHYGNVTINGTQNITGNARIFIDGTLTMRNSSELIVKSGGSLKLYLNGNLVSSNTGYITNENNNACNLQLFATDNCASIDLKAKSNFFGAIYAPNAEMDIYNSGDLYGAYVGNQTIEIKNSGSFYFDTRLLSVFVNDAPAYIGIVKGSWRED